MHLSGPLIRVARRGAATACAMLLGLGATIAVAPPASADAPVGHVRLAHLSPDTPAVDVYLSAAAGSAEPRVFRAVGYGVLSDYLPLPAGRYAVAMRPAGAPAGDPPALTTGVSVEAGEAYTVAGVGRYAGLGLKVLDDDLSAPAEGRAKVRVVQASVRAPVLDVAAANGPIIGNAVRFATTTPYEQVSGTAGHGTAAGPGAPPYPLVAASIAALLAVVAAAGIILLRSSRRRG